DLTGGTAQIVRYHLEGILPGSIERRSGSRPLFDRGDESLACHVACSRQNADGSITPPEAPLQPCALQWICQQDGRCIHPDIPDEFLLMFRRMSEFNDDISRYREPIDRRAAGAEERPVAAEQKNGLGMTASLFDASDWLALHFQRRVLLAMRGIHVL